MYLLGMLQGERLAGQEHLDYVQAQAERGMMIARTQTQVVVRTEVKYRDRIKTIYVKGDEIEKQVPVYVTAADDADYRVNVGFVRSYNASWTGEPAGSPASTDRDPAGIPLVDVAEAAAHNATACRAWRELALGLREYYEKQQEALK
jgi:hypothetical protein